MRVETLRTGTGVAGPVAVKVWQPTRHLAPARVCRPSRRQAPPMGSLKAAADAQVSAPVKAHQKVNCIFCSICNGKEASRTVFQNERLLVFWDHRPAATVHLLVVPKHHVKNINRLHGPADLELVREMHSVGHQLLSEMSPKAEHKFGYHVPPFTSVNHLHLHCFALPHTPAYKAFKYGLPGIWMTAQELETRLMSQS